jgi:hypothetical protein
MSFFVSCPVTGGLSVPRKSGPFDRLMVLSKVKGHTRNADLTIVYHGGRCPDLSGSACALLIGHAAKKDIPLLLSAKLLRRGVCREGMGLLRIGKVPREKIPR